MKYGDDFPLFLSRSSQKHINIVDTADSKTVMNMSATKKDMIKTI